jgi:long-subunit fatty acid transport protein
LFFLGTSLQRSSYLVNSKYVVKTSGSNKLAMDNKLSDGIKLLMQSSIIFIYSTTFGVDPKNINIISIGLQYKGIEKLPLRVGYTNSSNPITNELAFFSIPATAVIANAFQFSFSYPLADSLMVNGVYHYGTSDIKTGGSLLHPTPDVMGGIWNVNINPLGAVPGSTVQYEMTTSMIQFGVSYTFKK